MPVLQIQPQNSRTCGQHCIAMLAGEPVSKVIELMGENKTTAKQLARALEHFGFRSWDKLHLAPRKNKARWGTQAISICMVKIKTKEGKTLRHWILNWFGTVYDPSGIVWGSKCKYEKEMPRVFNHESCKITSSIRVNKFCSLIYSANN